VILPIALAIVVAGCTQTPSMPQGPGLSALEAFPAAAANATDWAADAVLVGVAGSEENRTRDYEPCQHGLLFPSERDGTLGDGRAPDWVFFWISDSKQSFVSVDVYLNQTVLRCELASRYLAMKGPALSSWIDSTVVAAKAWDDTAFRTFVQQHRDRIDYYLEFENGRTAWRVAALGPDGGPPLSAHVKVDARTGERIP
jgi:hypothetical protein